MQTVSLPCRICGDPVEIVESWVHAIGGRPLCETCQRNADQAERRTTLASAMEARWLKICPPAFLDTDTDKLPIPSLSCKALEWPAHTRPGTGLNLWGYPRTGKTRTMFLILRREHFAGRKVRVFGPSEFAQECELRDFRTAAWLRRLGSYDVLAFDDIDKCRMRVTHEEMFFAVIDYRLRFRKPCLFTGNANGSQLTTRFRSGEALVGRIRDTTLSIHFPQPQQTLL